MHHGLLEVQCGSRIGHMEAMGDVTAQILERPTVKISRGL